MIVDALLSTVRTLESAGTGPHVPECQKSQFERRTGKRNEGAKETILLTLKGQASGRKQ